MRAKAYSEIELLQRHGPNLREPTDKTPQREINKAKWYKDDYEMRCE